jgi:hypothetical protein
LPSLPIEIYALAKICHSPEKCLKTHRKYLAFTKPSKIIRYQKSFKRTVLFYHKKFPSVSLFEKDLFEISFWIYVGKKDLKLDGMVPPRQREQNFRFLDSLIIVYDGNVQVKFFALACEILEKAIAPLSNF